MTMDEIRVIDNPAEQRYELWHGETLAGVIQYRLRDNVVAMSHTEVEEHLQTQGLGTRLVADALADTQARGRTVKPYCPFVAAYIREHPEYEDLVAG
jgi:predicted GNAT family acetyltransferase